jgi:hypothetical protein
MSDSESSSDEEVFDQVDSTLPICLGVDSRFCQLIFEIKQMLYSDIMYEGPADSQEAQDTELNDRYEAIMGLLHTLLMNLFIKRGQQSDIPEEILQQFSPNVKDKVKELYIQCYQQSNNSDRNQRQHYKLLIQNLFHVYIYDMGSR